MKNSGNQANEKYFGLQVQLKVHGFNNLTHSRFTNIVGFYNGLVDNKHLCWVSCQDHLLTSFLMQLHHGHNMLTDNSQSLLYGGSRISLRALCLWLSLCHKFCACALADFSESGLGPKYSVLRYFGTRVPILQYSSVLSTCTFKKYLYSYLYSSTFKNKSTFDEYLRVLYEY